jgi:hypothetical protein
VAPAVQCNELGILPSGGKHAARKIKQLAVDAGAADEEIGLA